jgi:IK cytokine
MTILLQEMVTVSVDGSVLDRIAKIMTYLSAWIIREGLEKEKGER